MKAAEIKPCAICRKGVMHAGIPLFYRVKLETMGVDRSAVQQVHGLEQYFGGTPAGVRLAQIMGPDPDVAKPVGDAVDALVCHTCALELHPIAMLMETHDERAS